MAENGCFDSVLRNIRDDCQWQVLGSSLHNGTAIICRMQMRCYFHWIQLTEKGIDTLAKRVADVRAVIGDEIPLSTDHYGHFDLNNMIRLGRAVEKYRLAWLEDMVPWQYTEQHKTITDALETPTLTGEDIYLLQNFKPLIDKHAVDIVHPDLASSGGLLETKEW